MYRLFGIATAAGTSGFAAFAYANASPLQAKTDEKLSAAGASGKKEVVIVGAGTAGLSVAAQLLKKRRDALNVTLIDPSEYHYYQPGWTLVGAGIKSFPWSRRATETVVPKGATWLRGKCTSIDPDTNAVTVSPPSTDPKKIPYDYLVVAAGMDMKWNAVPGMSESIFGYEDIVRSVREKAESGDKGRDWSAVLASLSAHSPVVSNYAGGEGTFAALREFPAGGIGLFVSPPAPIKCGGAPLKAVFLTYDWLKHSHGKDFMRSATLEFLTSGGSAFPVMHYNPTIENLFRERNIPVITNTLIEHIEVPAPADAPRPPNGAPPFRGVVTVKTTPAGAAKPEVSRKGFHMLHVVPPMSSPAVVKESPLANAAGYAEVDKLTLQSPRYPNVFALGDASSIPTSKTGAAAIAQAPVLVHNLLRTMDGKIPTAHYDGYTSCPLVVSRHPPALLLMEFDFNKQPKESFPWDQRKPYGFRGRIHYFMKEKVFPWAYWNRIPKAQWYGSRGPFEPHFPDP